MCPYLNYLRLLLLSHAILRGTINKVRQKTDDVKSDIIRLLTYRAYLAYLSGFFLNSSMQDSQQK